MWCDRFCFFWLLWAGRRSHHVMDVSCWNKQDLCGPFCLLSLSLFLWTTESFFLKNCNLLWAKFCLRLCLSSSCWIADFSIHRQAAGKLNIWTNWLGSIQWKTSSLDSVLFCSRPLEAPLVGAKGSWSPLQEGYRGGVAPHRTRCRDQKSRDQLGSNDRWVQSANQNSIPSTDSDKI